MTASYVGMAVSGVDRSLLPMTKKPASAERIYLGRRVRPPDVAEQVLGLHHGGIRETAPGTRTAAGPNSLTRMHFHTR